MARGGGLSGEGQEEANSCPDRHLSGSLKDTLTNAHCLQTGTIFSGCLSGDRKGCSVPMAGAKGLRVQ